MEFDRFAEDIAMLAGKEELKYQQKLEEEFVKLETKFQLAKQAFGDVMPAAEHCRAPVHQFHHLISGRLFCFAGRQVHINNFVCTSQRLTGIVDILSA